MEHLFSKIRKFNKIKSLSKHEQIVNSINALIDEKVLRKGDALPSINMVISETRFARKTVFKAYEKLKHQGIIESKRSQGYYIVNTNTKIKLKVALILFASHPFQIDFYNTFREELGKKYHIDVFYHHNDLTVFKNILSITNKKYGMYVIAPIQHPETSDLLQIIPPKNLLIIDRFIKMPKEYSYISQEFEKSTYELLEKIYQKIKKYKKIILFFRDDSDYPKGILRGFQKFIKKYDILGDVEKKYCIGDIKKNYLYFFISDFHLWEVLKDCKKAEYTLGKDVGILAQDDNIVKEIVFGGITTISTDFKEMARESAVYTKYGHRIHKIIPSKLIRRNSL